MNEYLLLILASYLIGSIPFAFIIVKLFARKNVLSEGSGNVGAMNSYEITRKKWIGILVFLFDFFKGFVVVLLTKHFFRENEFTLLLSSFFVVFGHNYSIYLRFRGGKGLATTSGVLFLIQPIMLFVWFVIWLLFYNFVKKDMDFANPFATILTPFCSIAIPENFANQAAFIPLNSKLLLFVNLAVIALIISSKYFSVIMKFLKK